MEILKSLEGVDLVAVCDPVNDIRKQRQEEYKVEKGYAEVSAMLANENLDAIVAAPPPHLNAKVAMECLDAGVDTLLEKPPGFTIDEAITLRDTSVRTGAKAMVGWNRRFHPMLLQAQAMVLKRGPIIQLVAEFHKSAKEIESKNRYDAFVMDRLFLESPIHAIDTICALANSKVVEVQGLVRRATTSYRDVHAGVILFESGCVASIIANYTAGARLERYEIHGDEISCYLEGIRTGVAYIKGEKVELEGIQDTSAVDQDRYFIDCVRSGCSIERPGANLDTAVETMELAHDILENIRN